MRILIFSLMILTVTEVNACGRRGRQSTASSTYSVPMQSTYSVPMSSGCSGGQGGYSVPMQSTYFVPMQSTYFVPMQSTYSVPMSSGCSGGQGGYSVPMSSGGQGGYSVPLMPPASAPVPANPKTAVPLVPMLRANFDYTPVMMIAKEEVC